MVTNHGILVVLIPFFSDKPIDEWIDEFCFLIATVSLNSEYLDVSKPTVFFGGGWESSYREAVALAARRVEAHRARLLTFRADLRFCVHLGFVQTWGAHGQSLLLQNPIDHCHIPH